MLEPDLFAPFIDGLNRLGAPYMVTGSTAGTLYGEPRLTHDIDIVVALTPAQVDAFGEIFSLDDFYCPPRDVLLIELKRGHRGHCNLIHHTTGFKADIYFPADELHRWGLAHRRQLQVDGRDVWVAPPEYVILRKLEYFRDGGSEKHLRDIRSMLAMSSEQIDRGFVTERAVALGLAEVWQRAQA